MTVQCAQERIKVILPLRPDSSFLPHLISRPEPAVLVGCALLVDLVDEDGAEEGVGAADDGEPQPHRLPLVVLVLRYLDRRVRTGNDLAVRCNKKMAS